MLKKLDNFAIFFLLLFSGISFLFGLGNTYLTNWDEAWYAGISRNMLERKDFIVPYWNGAPYFDKGPLYHWLSVLAYQIFPSWEIAARLPSALAGIGCVVLVYFLGKHLFGQKVGLLSGLVLTSTIGFLFRARTGNLDALMVFLILASFLFFFLSLKKPVFFLAFGTVLGLLFLTKTAFIIHPLITLVLFLLFSKRVSVFKNIFFIGSLLVATSIACAWLILGAKQEGQPFLSFYQNLLFWPITKIGISDTQTKGFSWHYLPYLYYGTKIWFFFFLPAFVFSLIRALKNKEYFFLIAAFLPYFFVLLWTKEAGDWYLLPLYPITAIMIGAFYSHLQENILPKRTWAFLLITVFLCLATFKNLYFRHLFITPESVQNEVALAKEAKLLTNQDESVIVDDYYFPVASFYSERKIKVVRREAADTALVLSKDSFYRILRSPKNVVFLTTSQNFSVLQKDLKEVNFKIEKQADSHLLVKKQ